MLPLGNSTCGKFPLHVLGGPDVSGEVIDLAVGVEEERAAEIAAQRLDGEGVDLLDLFALARPGMDEVVQLEQDRVDLRLFGPGEGRERGVSARGPCESVAHGGAPTVDDFFDEIGLPHWPGRGSTWRVARSRPSGGHIGRIGPGLESGSGDAPETAAGRGGRLGRGMLEDLRGGPCPQEAGTNQGEDGREQDQSGRRRGHHGQCDHRAEPDVDSEARQAKRRVAGGDAHPEGN